jgi:hypothetical protein
MQRARFPVAEGFEPREYEDDHQRGAEVEHAQLAERVGGLANAAPGFAAPFDAAGFLISRIASLRNATPPEVAAPMWDKRDARDTSRRAEAEIVRNLQLRRSDRVKRTLSDL